MRHKILSLMVILLATALALSACTQEPEAAKKEAPVHLEPIEGSEFQRVVLTEKAAHRLDIQTGAVQEDTVMRTRVVGGKVLASPSLSSGDVVEGSSTGSGANMSPEKVWVLVSLNESDLGKVDRAQQARILPFDDDDEEDEAEENELFAEADEGADDDDSDDVSDSALFYALDNADQALTVGQLVRVVLPLQSGGSARKVIPYSAVLYGLHGETWVYTNPEPLVYIRYPITVDYIDGDQAVLVDGPPVGTAVVTVGSAELFGAESGVGGKGGH